jgi:hypothetical protein
MNPILKETLEWVYICTVYVSIGYLVWHGTDPAGPDNFMVRLCSTIFGMHILAILVDCFFPSLAFWRKWNDL